MSSRSSSAKSTTSAAGAAAALVSSCCAMKARASWGLTLLLATSVLLMSVRPLRHSCVQNSACASWLWYLLQQQWQQRQGTVQINCLAVPSHKPCMQSMFQAVASWEGVLVRFTYDGLRTPSH